MNTVPPTDLTKRPPRSARTRLGGYTVLPRMIDKCRAVIAGTAGEYHFDCTLDRQFLDFVKIDPEAFKIEVAKGKGDSELLAWIREHAENKLAPHEIASWSAFQDTRAPDSVYEREFFQDTHRGIAEKRDNITTWFDLLDMEDFALFGGIV